MNNSTKLFIKFDDSEISLITGNIDDQNSFELLEKLVLKSDSIIKNSITDLDRTTNLIKKNILIIEQKVNYTFKDIIIILNNLEISFLNLCGFKKLNGSQITKENITYILNSLKSHIDELEKNKKILHIFNSEYCLDKKKLDNLPIGLFGDLYSHELSFNMIKENDLKNLKTMFDTCNIKIKKIITESFVKGAIINNSNPSVDTFLHIQISENNCKIFYTENSSIKFEEVFKFGSKMIEKDISKVTSLNLEIVNKIIEDNLNMKKISDDELISHNYFIGQEYRKIKKNLILEIAKARINEFAEILFYKNINFKEFLNKVNFIFLEINDQKNFNCFQQTYTDIFSFNDKFEVKILKKPQLEKFIEAAFKITQFGWKKEAIPQTKETGSYISRFFKSLFA